MKTRITSVILIALAIISFNVSAQEGLPTKEKWAEESIRGEVTAIKAETREITLMGPKGNLVTMTAGEEVKRFDEIAVGDVIEFDYFTYFKAEFRAPTEEELAEPLVVVAEGGKAPEGMDPAAIVGAVVRAVVSIEVLNRPYMLVTVRGPQGNYTTIPMRDTELIKKLNVGQVVILTYAEAFAVSLEKVASAPAAE